MMTTSLKSYPLSRRTFLRGLGVTMALPWLESMPVWGDVTATHVASEAPTRLAVLFSGNGFHSSQWWAKGEGEAMDALAQLADHAALLRQPAPPPAKPIRLAAKSQFLNEAESLAMLAQAGVPVIEHRLCRDEPEVRTAVAQLGGDVVLKACSRDLPHKSDHGLVAIGVADPLAEFRRQRERCLALGARFEGVIVARRARGGRELALGARVDPSFGPLVLVGDGGIYLEALKDFRLLIPPFAENEVLAKLAELRIAPLFGVLRGQPARDIRAFARMAVQLGDAIIAWDGRVGSVDVNPVMLFETGALALDALVESRADD